jgi:hypothetical protein
LSWLAREYQLMESTLGCVVVSRLSCLRHEFSPGTMIPLYRIER